MRMHRIEYILYQTITKQEIKEEEEENKKK